MQNAYIVPRGQSLDEIYIEGRILRVWLWAFAWRLDFEGASTHGQRETIFNSFLINKIKFRNFNKPRFVKSHSSKKTKPSPDIHGFEKD